MELPGGVALKWVQYTPFTDESRDIQDTRYVPSGAKSASMLAAAGIPFYSLPAYAYIPPGTGEFVTQYKPAAIRGSAPGGDGPIVAASFYMRFITVDPDWSRFRRPTTFQPKDRLAWIAQNGITPLTLKAYTGWIWRDTSTMWGDQPLWKANSEACSQTLSDRGHMFSPVQPQQLDALRKLGYGSEQRVLHIDSQTPACMKNWMLTGRALSAEEEREWRNNGLTELELRDAIPSRGFLAGDLLYRAAKNDSASFIAIVDEYAPPPAESVVHLQYFRNGVPSGGIVTRRVTLDPTVFYFEYLTNIGLGRNAHHAFRGLIAGPGITFNEGQEYYGLGFVPMVVLAHGSGNAPATNAFPAKAQAEAKPVEAPSGAMMPVLESRTLQSGLVIDELQIGTGKEAGANSTIKFHYHGTFQDGTVFDSSRGKSPLEVPLNGLIKGFQEGVPGMRVGGIRRLTVPGDLGYGASGAANVIPPNATLVFAVELIDVK